MGDINVASSGPTVTPLQGSGGGGGMGHPAMSMGAGIAQGFNEGTQTLLATILKSGEMNLQAILEKARLKSVEDQNLLNAQVKTFGDLGQEMVALKGMYLQRELEETRQKGAINQEKLRHHNALEMQGFTNVSQGMTQAFASVMDSIKQGTLKFNEDSAKRVEAMLNLSSRLDYEGPFATKTRSLDEKGNAVASDRSLDDMISALQVSSVGRDGNRDPQALFDDIMRPAWEDQVIEYQRMGYPRERAEGLANIDVQGQVGKFLSRARLADIRKEGWGSAVQKNIENLEKAYVLGGGKQRLLSGIGSAESHVQELMQLLVDSGKEYGFNKRQADSIRLGLDGFSQAAKSVITAFAPPPGFEGEQAESAQDQIFILANEISEKNFQEVDDFRRSLLRMDRQGFAAALSDAPKLIDPVTARQLATQQWQERQKLTDQLVSPEPQGVTTPVSGGTGTSDLNPLFDAFDRIAELNKSNRIPTKSEPVTTAPSAGNPYTGQTSGSTSAYPAAKPFDLNQGIPEFVPGKPSLVPRGPMTPAWSLPSSMPAQLYGNRNPNDLDWLPLATQPGGVP